MDENTVASPNEAEVTVPETVEVNAENEVDWKSKAEKAAELANNYKIRAEKAEKAARGTPKNEGSEAKESRNPDLSYKDILALTNAKVAEDDFEEVMDYAKFKGISIADALKTDTIKATLTTKSEMRKTANATATGSARRSSGKVSDESLIESAEKGNLPTSDEGIEALVNARHNLKKKA